MTQGEHPSSTTDAPASASLDLAATLTRIESELGRVHARLDHLESVAREGEQIVAIAADTLDEHVGRLRARGVDIDERLERAARIGEALTTPALLERVESLLGRTTEVATALNTLEALPGLLATMADAADTTVARIQESGIDIDERLRGLLVALDQLTSPSALRGLHAMFGTKPEEAASLCTRNELSPMLQFLVDAADALDEARNQTRPQLGLFGMMRALSEPDVREASTLVIHIARGLGRRLKQTQRSGRLLANGENA